MHFVYFGFVVADVFVVIAEFVVDDVIAIVADAFDDFAATVAAAGAVAVDTPLVMEWLVDAMEMVLVLFDLKIVGKMDDF